MGSRRGRIINLHAHLKRQNYEDRTDTTALFSREELRHLKSQVDKQAANLPFYLVGDVKSLQFHINHLQEKGLCSINCNFKYSPVDESYLMYFICNPANVSQMSSGKDALPNPLSSRKHSLNEILSARKINPKSNAYEA